MFETVLNLLDPIIKNTQVLLPILVIFLFLIGALFAIGLWLINRKNFRMWEHQEEEDKQQEKRLKFYSVFVVLFISILIQLLGWFFFNRFILFPDFFTQSESLFLDDDYFPSPFIWLVFSLGFFPFSLLWLELILSRSFSDLGFTFFYKENLKKISLFQKWNQRKNKSPGVEKLFSMLSWVLSFWVSPFLLLQVKTNWKRKVSFWFGFIQLNQDILYVFSLLLSLFGLFCWAFPNVLSISYFDLASFFTFALFVQALWVSLVIIGAFSFLPKKQNKHLSFSGTWFLYMAFLLVDFSYGDIERLWVDNNTIIGDRFATFTGGYTPWALIAATLQLIFLFFVDLSFTLEKGMEKIEERLNTNLTNRVFHNFANKLFPPISTLNKLEEEFSQIENLQKLGEDPQRAKIYFKLIQNSLKALSTAKELTLDIKKERRRQFTLKWNKLSTLMEDNREIFDKEEGIDFQLQSQIPKIDLEVDQEMFSQIIQNLVNNAKEAIRLNPPPQPKISLKMNYHPNHEFPLEILIEDNGPGIPKEIQGSIFKSYFSTKAKGSGLGLNIVQGHMEQDLEGRVEFTSKGFPPDTFTCFSLKFPAKHVRKTKPT